MDNLFLVEGMQSVDHLVEDAPDVLFLHVPHGALELVDLGLQVTTISVLHDDAERARALLEECFFVSGDVFMID